MSTDNQQEIGLIAYLAGIIDGEGTVSLTVSQRSLREGRHVTIRTTPKVIIANTDPGIIEQSLRALALVGVGKYVRTERSQRAGWKTTRATYKPVTIIEVAGFMRLAKLLPAVLPYLAGDKKQRSEILLRFISGRMQRATDLKKAANIAYTEEDASLIMEFLALTRSKNTEHVAKILNEHTREARIDFRKEYRRQYQRTGSAPTRIAKMGSGLTGDRESRQK